jgi:hypothetical protein
MMWFLNSDHPRAHTAEACVQAFYASLKSWRTLITTSRSKSNHRARAKTRIEPAFEISVTALP